MGDATLDPAVRFAVLGVDHPHAIVLTAELLGAGAECIGWVETPGEPDGLFAALLDSIPRIELDDAIESAPDLAVIAAVPSLRSQLAIDAMESGADVLVDKPAATGPGQLAEIDAAIAATGRRWWVAFTEHFTSRAVTRADAIVASGRLGTVRHVLGLGPHRLGSDRPAWFRDPLQTGPMIADLATHQIHHAARLLGTTELDVVAARTTAAPDGSHPELLGELLLEGGTGSAYCRVDWMTPTGLDTWGDVRLLITGDDGTIEVRANADPGGEPGGDHLIVVDADGIERIDCREDELTWARRLCADVHDGTETVVTTAHSLAVSRLALEVAEVARR